MKSIKVVSIIICLFLFWQLSVTIYFAAQSTLIGDTGNHLILDRRGSPLRTTLSSKSEKRIDYALSDIPAVIKEAFIASEDRRFYSHWGVDFLSLLRIAKNIVTRFNFNSGASTITMQVARILHPKLKSRTYKLSQMMLAFYLETKWSKGEILQFYLNHVPFGFGRIGVGAACQFFFGKSCELLSQAEMVSLAVIPRGPTFYTQNLPQLTTQRNKLLSRLQLEVDVHQKVNFNFSQSEFLAPHFTNFILNARPQAYHLLTTIDANLQQEVQQLLYTHTEKNPRSGDAGAVLIVDNGSSEVLAYVGSPNYRSSVSGMLDHIQTKRSPGSALKPFLYALGLENNFRTSSLLPDIPMMFSTGKKIYEPSNYSGDFAGPLLLRPALANSKNLPALYLVNNMGVVHFLDFLKKIHLTNTNKSPDHFGVGIAIGNLEVNLMDLVAAYQIFPNGGNFRPIQILKDQPTIMPKRVISSETAYLISHILADNDARSEDFGRFGYLEFDFPLSVKTGTSNDYRDNWVIAFNPKYTIGIWRGNASGAPMKAKLPAAQGIGPLLRSIVKLLPMDAKNGPAPSTLTQVAICPVSGGLPGQFCPTKKFELHVKTNLPKHTCSFHKEITIPNCRGVSRTIPYVQLPQEYTEWANTSDLPTLKRELSRECGTQDLKLALLPDSTTTHPTITYPLNNTTFAHDPRIPKTHQKVKFQFAGNSRSKVKFIINNSDQFELLKNQDHYYWTLEKGNHTFSLQDDAGNRSNSVEIKVF